jgi:hypothetical protein
MLYIKLPNKISAERYVQNYFTKIKNKSCNQSKVNFIELYVLNA